MTELLSKDHRILERAYIEYPPFGINSRGEKIRDVSGVTVRANVDYLEELVSRTEGPKEAVEELCQRSPGEISPGAEHRRA